MTQSRCLVNHNNLFCGSESTSHCKQSSASALTGMSAAMLTTQQVTCQLYSCIQLESVIRSPQQPRVELLATVCNSVLCVTDLVLEGKFVCESTDRVIIVSSSLLSSLN